MPRSNLIVLLRERSFREGDFVLASGRRSRFYVDARRTTMTAQGMDLVGRLGLRAIRDAGWEPGLVGGLTLGADPVAYAVALASLNHPPVMDAFTVRKEAKRHGTGSRIEGASVAGNPVVIAEDVITTGGSALAAVEAVRAEGGKVLGVLAVVDREEGGRQAIEDTGVPVIVLVTVGELASVQ